MTSGDVRVWFWEEIASETESLRAAVQLPETSRAKRHGGASSSVQNGHDG